MVVYRLGQYRTDASEDSVLAPSSRWTQGNVGFWAVPADEFLLVVNPFDKIARQIQHLSDKERSLRKP